MGHDEEDVREYGRTGGHDALLEHPVSNFVRNSPFFFISLVIHIAVLALLAFVTASEGRPMRRRVAIVVEEYEIPEELPPLVREENLFDIGSAGGSIGAGGEGTETFEAVKGSTAEHIAEHIDILGITAPTGMGTGGDFAGEGGEDWNLAPGTGSGEGIEGAVDQFAIVTINSMTRGKTLVVLLVDRSRSIIYDDLPLVIARMDHYFGQIEQHVPAGLEDRGRWAVVSYGRSPQLMCQPSNNLPYVKNALASVEVDVSGVENIGKAVEFVLDKYGGRDYDYLLIAVMTDEAGDDILDPKVLESAIKQMRQAHARLFVFGYESRFSARKKEIIFRLDPELLRGADKAAVKGFEGRTVYGWADGGPECPRPELWWSANWYNWRNVWGGTTNNIPAGFGMYGLNRMVLATNGIYFLLQVESDYDEEKLYAQYKPDICSMPEYDKRMGAHPLRRELKNVWKEMGYFYLGHDLRTPEQVRNALDKSRQGRDFCMEYASSLNKLLKTSKPVGHNWQRWVAHGDLTLAELLRLRFMLGQYHEVLDRHWASINGNIPQGKRLLITRGRVPDDFVGPREAKDEYDAARHYIDEVVRKHVGTPWEVLGKRLVDGLHPWTASIVDVPTGGTAYKPIPPSLSNF